MQVRSFHDVDQAEADFCAGADLDSSGRVPKRVLHYAHDVEVVVAVIHLEIDGRLGQIDPVSIDGQCPLPNVVAGQIGFVGQLRVAFEVQRSVAEIGHNPAKRSASNSVPLGATTTSTSLYSCRWLTKSGSSRSSTSSMSQSPMLSHSGAATASVARCSASHHCPRRQ